MAASPKSGCEGLQTGLSRCGAGRSAPAAPLTPTPAPILGVQGGP